MKISKNLFFVTLLLITGCKACEIDLDDQLGNSDSTPEELTASISPTGIQNALQKAIGANGVFCELPNSFEARVKVEVRTASEVDGTIVVDPETYGDGYGSTILIQDGPGINDETRITFDVPSEGSFLLDISIEVQECSPCCYGNLNESIQCGLDSYVDGNGVRYCKGGYPVLNIEKILTDIDRPFDILPDVTFDLSKHYHVRKCFDCGSCEFICTY